MPFWQNISHNIHERKHVLMETYISFLNRLPDYNIIVFFLICDDNSIEQWQKYTIQYASMLCLFSSISIFDLALYLTVWNTHFGFSFFFHCRISSTVSHKTRSIWSRYSALSASMWQLKQDEIGVCFKCKAQTGRLCIVKNG